jgi:hypothetical protein
MRGNRSNPAQLDLWGPEPPPILPRGLLVLHVSDLHRLAGLSRKRVHAAIKRCDLQAVQTTTAGKYIIPRPAAEDYLRTCGLMS